VRVSPTRMKRTRLFKASSTALAPDTQPMGWRWQAAVMLPLAAAFTWFAFGVRGMYHLSGDEPHYLAITQGLWLYHTLDQHRVLYQHDFFAYFPHLMSSHSLHRGRHLYPLHYLGLPLVMLPGFALAGAPGAEVTALLISLLVCWRALHVCARVAGPVAASISVLGMGLAVPFVSNAPTIYPDLLAALLLVLGYEVVDAPTLTARRALTLGLLLAAMPWVHAKLLVAVAALALWALYSLWRSRDTLTPQPHADWSLGSAEPTAQPALLRAGEGGQSVRSPLPRTGRRVRGEDLVSPHMGRGARGEDLVSPHMGRGTGVRTPSPLSRAQGEGRGVRAALVLGLPLLSVGGLLFFNGWLYGSPTLTAQFSLRGQALLSGNPLSGLAGQLFAQGQGMLGTGPFLLLVIPGAVALWRRDRETALKVGLVTLPYWLVTLTYHDWWGGDCPPLRYLLPLLPLWSVGTAALLAGLRTLAARLAVAAFAGITLALLLVLPSAPRLGWPLPGGQSATLVALGNMLHLPLTYWLPTFVIVPVDNGLWRTPWLIAPWALGLLALWLLLAGNERLATRRRR